MNATTIYTVVFSPTGTSKKIAAAVAQGVCGASCERAGNAPAASTGSSAGTDATLRTAGAAETTTAARTSETATATGIARTAEAVQAPVSATTSALTPIDLTHTEGKRLTLPAGAVAVFAVPVYGGQVAPAALARMQEIRGEGTPAVLIAVYGNRAFGSAVRQLARFVAQRGFIPVAAGAFVGEHSYSTQQTPIAQGRPDARDLAAATEFGVRIRHKLGKAEVEPIDASRLRAPRTPILPQLRFVRFVVGYRKRQKKNPVVLLPAGDAARCTQCGKCAALCPTQAIARGDELHTDPTRCIRCCACVKGCPTGARSFETPFAAVLARNFARRKPPVTLL